MQGIDRGRLKAVAGFGTLIWLLGLLDIYLKHLFLKYGLYLAVIRVWGRNSTAELTSLERLAMFRHDIWQSLIFFPIAIVLLFLPLKLLYRRIVAGVLVVAGTFLFFINLQGLGNVRRFLALPMIHDAIQWGWDHPEYISDYVSLSSFIKLLIILAAFIVLTKVSGSSPQKTPSLLNRSMAAAFPWLLGITGAIGALSFASPMPVRAVGPSAAERIYTTLRDNQASAGRFAGMTMNEVSAYFARVTRTPSDAETEPGLAGTEKGSNIIFFVVETGPARAYHPLHSAPEKVVSDLLPNSFVSMTHYSTYPYTSDALFSVFSGLYPLMRRTLLRRAIDLRFGWVEQLQEMGYETRAYAPYRDTFENDTTMFQTFGFKDRYLADGDTHGPSPAASQRLRDTLAAIPNTGDEKARGHLKERLNFDLMALERFENDIRDFEAKKQPYLAVYLPQIGHAPWFDLVGTSDIPKRGEAIIRLELKWLEGLVEQLRARGTLSKTIIVLTADHGIRDTQEDPSFIPSTVSDYSFEVPLMIYAPNTLRATRAVSGPTSHVDIGPTLLSLLGIRNYRWPLHGTVIWSPHLRDRLIYFFAADYYGSDGTYSHGEFLSCSTMTEECRKNNRFDFPPKTSVPPAEARRDEEFLQEATSLQIRIAELLAAGVKTPKASVANRVDPHEGNPAPAPARQDDCLISNCTDTGISNPLRQTPPYGAAEVLQAISKPSVRRS